MITTALRLASRRRIGHRTFPFTAANNGNLLQASSHTVRWPIEPNALHIFFLPVLPKYRMNREEVKQELRKFLSSAERAGP